MRRRKVLARSVRTVIESLESRVLLSAVFNEGAGTAIVQGSVFNDINGNGIVDSGEAGVAGITVQLAQVGVTYAPGTIPAVQTDANGSFAFTELAAGQYTATIVPTAGYIQDAPGSTNFSVAAGADAVYQIGETNVPAGGGSGSGSITGTLFNDLNQDGIQQAGEQSLSGDTVYLDLNGSGVLGANDPKTTTDPAGGYSFNGLRSQQQLNFANNTTGGTFVLDFADASTSPALATTKTAPITFDPTNAAGDNTAAIQNDINAIDPNGGVTVTSPSTTIDTITSATESANTVAVTVASGTVYTVGETVTIANVVPAGFNGSFTVIVGGTGSFAYTNPNAGLGTATSVTGATSTTPGNPFQYTITYNRVGPQTAIATDPTTALTLAPPTTATLNVSTSQVGTVTQPAVQTLSFGPLTSGGLFALDLSDASATPVVTTSPTGLITFDPTNNANDNTNAIRNAIDAVDPNGGVIVTNGSTPFNYIVTYLLDGPQTTMVVDHATSLLTAPSPLTETVVQAGTKPLPPGVYDVRVVPRTGFHQDPPAYVQVVVNSDQTTIANIGENNRTTISGVVFDDLNGNGVQDVGEAPVAGETVFLDLPLSGTLVAGDPVATTNANGVYSFAGLTPGFYRVEIQSASGMIMDTPEFIDVTLTPGESLILNLAEGLPASVSGVVFDDKNADGIREPGEPGVPNQVVFLDINNNGVQDGNPIASDGMPISYAEPSAVTAADGSYTISSAVPASALTEASVQTGTATLPSIQSLTFAPYVTGGTFALDFSDASIIPAITTRSTAQIRFDPLNTANDNTLAIQAAINAIDPLGGVTVSNGTDAFHYIVTYKLNGAQALITTDAASALTTGLGPGTYTMRMIFPSGSVPTAPVTAGHAFTFTLGSGTQLSGKDFGYQTADLTISSFKIPTKPVVAGVSQTAAVRVTNVGNLTGKGNVSIDLYAQTVNAALDTTTAVYLGNFAQALVRLTPGLSHLFKFKFSYPLQIAQGSYYIFGQIVSDIVDNDIPNNTTAPTGPVAVTPPFIDLNNVFAIAPATIVDPGQVIPLTVKVTNYGNTTTSGEMSFRTYITVNSMLEPNDVVAQTNYFKNIAIKPGKSRLFHITVQSPGPSLGSRFIFVAVDSGDALGDVNIRQVFAENGFVFTTLTPTVAVVTPNLKWTLTDGTTVYTLAANTDGTITVTNITNTTLFTIPVPTTALMAELNTNNLPNEVALELSTDGTTVVPTLFK